MRKSACLFIFGLALHGSLGWGVGESCEDKDCDNDSGVTTATGDAADSTQGPTAREPKPEETFITDVKAGIGGGQFDPEAAKGAYAGLPNDDSREAALDSLKALAEKEKDTGKAKQLADLAAELEHRADYEKLDEETLRAKKAILLSKVLHDEHSQGDAAQARLITKILAEKKAEDNGKAEGAKLATVPDEKIVRGNSRIPISVSADKRTQFIPSKIDGIVSVSTDGGRSFTDLPEEKFGLKRNSDGTYSQSDKRTVSTAGAPEAIGVIQRTGGKDPAFEYQYTNQDGKQVVGFQNSQGQWVEGNPKANSYSRANPPPGYEVKNGRLARTEQSKPASAPAALETAIQTRDSAERAMQGPARESGEWTAKNQAAEKAQGEVNQLTAEAVRQAEKRRDPISSEKSATALPDPTPDQIATLAEKYDTALFGVSKDDATNFYMHLRSLGYSDDKAYKWALEAMKRRARNPDGVSITKPSSRGTASASW